MTSRRQSKLSEDELWVVPATPPPADPETTPTPAATGPGPAGQQTAAAGSSRADARTREMRGHARNLAEARGRKRTRDAAYAWASATRRARDREAEFADELAAARQRGTDPAQLAAYIREACDRYDVDLELLPASLRETVGLTTGAAGPSE